MLYYIIKVIISAGIVVVVSEVSKRSTLLGSIFASMPLVSILAFIWLFYETNDNAQVAKLSTSIFWLVIPSLSMFITLPLLLKKYNFYISLVIAIIVMLICYYLMVYILNKFGIRL